MAAFEKLTQKFHGTIPLEKLSSKVWSLRQYHSLRNVFKKTLPERTGFYLCILSLDSFTAFLYWILKLGSFSCCKVLISTPCSRDKITVKVQLGKSSLIVENISTKFIEFRELIHKIHRTPYPAVLIYKRV